MSRLTDYPVGILSYGSAEYVDISLLKPSGKLYKALRGAAKSESELGVGDCTEACLVPLAEAPLVAARAGRDRFAMWMTRQAVSTEPDTGMEELTETEAFTSGVLRSVVRVKIGRRTWLHLSSFIKSIGYTATGNGLTQAAAKMGAVRLGDLGVPDLDSKRFGAKANRRAHMVRPISLLLFLQSGRRSTRAATEAFEQLGGTLRGVGRANIEGEVVGIIEACFSARTMVRQRPVRFEDRSYRIDLYFPDYGVAVEVDERGHRDRDEDYERIRQEHITEVLGCVFYRVDPDSPDFDMKRALSGLGSLLEKRAVEKAVGEAVAEVAKLRLELRGAGLA